MSTFRQSLALNGTRATSNLSNIKWRMSRAERVAITQLEISRPSDAPSQWTAVHRMAAATEDQGTFRANTEAAITYLDTADTLLSDGTDVLKRAWEIGVQMANETHSALSRTAAATEIASLRTRMLSIANTRVANRHVFAGTAMDKPPFDDSGNYVGATESLDVRIGYLEWIQVGFDGSEVFTGDTDVFQALDDLSAALEADDTVAIRDQLPEMKGGIDQMIRWREEVGFNQQLADDTIEMVRSLKTVIDTRLGETVQANPEEAYTNLSNIQTNYQATLSILASSSNQNLFSMIR